MLSDYGQMHQGPNHGMGQCRTTNLNQFGTPGFKKKISQSICTLPSSPSKCYKPMFLELFSPYLALIHEGHHAPEGRGRDGKGGEGGRKDHRESRTRVDERRKLCHTLFVGHSAAEVEKD